MKEIIKKGRQTHAKKRSTILSDGPHSTDSSTNLENEQGEAREGRRKKLKIRKKEMSCVVLCFVAKLIELINFTPGKHKLIET